ncbi:MAG: sigma-70 family RNA polymerase sigma factor [Anaerolineales bacterium]|jgi:RNA polymerase sigma-70 factor (ECF subfamily)
MALNRQATIDDELLIRSVKGDAEAFGNLYERHMLSIYRYMYARVGEVREAEDLTETVFIKVWQALPKFKMGKASFRTWLFRVAHNLLVDHFRTRKEELELPADSMLQSSSPLPEEQVIAMERSEYIGSVIRRLKPQYQQILTLRFINELSHEEAAQVMERSIGSVRVLQHRALKALQDQLGQSGGYRD